MGNINLILFICLFIPMSMMLLIFKGQSRLICGFLLIGMFVCVFSGEINGLIINSYNLNRFTYLFKYFFIFYLQKV